MNLESETKKHVIELLGKGIRLDGRKLLEYRKPLRVNYGISVNAEGSASVQIGETLVFAGVKLAIEQPYPDTPDEGLLVVGAELLPLANPRFEMGPPGIEAIELARIVDRGIRESGFIDLKKLCIEPGEKAWAVMIDICPINDAGNLFDASALAAFAALRNTVFPAVVDGKIDYGTKTNKKLPLTDANPVSVTVFKIGDHFIIDPTTEEQELYDARLTVASMSDGRLCALQKGGDAPLSADDIQKMVKIGIQYGKELRKLVIK
ncbi:RNA-binding protein [Candidatus Woesearchaeota archaeon]|nr:MAG: RNA-binding protein [Candidatus Woesearchaeota archaeon]